MKKLSLLAFLLIFLACEKPEEKSDETDTNVEAIAVEFLPAVSLSEPITFRSSGTIRPVQKTMVLAKTNGDVQRFSPVLGKSITAKQNLLSVESSVEKAALDQAKAVLESAQLNYDAIADLYEKGSVSKAEFIGAKSQLASAKFGVIQSRKMYSNCFVRSPFAGVVSWVDESIKPKGLIAAGTPLCEISDLRKMKIDLYFGESRAAQIAAGDSVALLIPVLQETLAAKVTVVSPSADAATGSFKIEITVANSGSLKGGMRADATIFTAGSRTGIKLPAMAVRQFNGREGLFLAEKGEADTVRFVPVTYEPNGATAWISSGITGGERVITSGFSRLKRGTEVTLTERTEAN